jgi:uncharacterized protein (TIGR00730 family)
MKTITFFGGARSGKDPEFEMAASAIGAFCGQYHCLAKFGGSVNGLMGAFARGFLDAEKQSKSGAKLIGVLPEKFSKINNPQSLGIEFILTETLTERKFHLLDKVDLFVVSPGGTGTLDEIFECMEQDYLPVDRDPRFADYSMRPILILNQNGYYDHTIAQLKYMMEQELLIPQKVAALHFYNSLEEFLAAIGRHLD